jgi:carboxypeptidase Q
MFQRWFIILVVSFAVFSGSGISQTPAEKIDTVVIAKMKDEGMNRSQVMTTISDITDVCGPRLTGSPEYRKAAEWAKRKLESIGLSNTAIEPWGEFGRGWTLKKFYAMMTEPQVLPLIAYPKAWSPAVKGILKGDAILLDVKSEADLEKYKGKLKGAIVLISDLREVKPHFKPEAERLSADDLLRLANIDVPRTRGRMNMFGDSSAFRRNMEQANLNRLKLELCQKEGAAVLIETSRGDGGTLIVQGATVPQPSGVPFDRRMGPYDPKAPKIIPQVVVAAEHYDRMVRAIQKGVKVKMELALEAEFTDVQDGLNIVGEIPGSDLGDEIVMIGGHFDSWHGGTGATDDATGCAVCIEAMRILKTLDLKPRRTIRIGLWDGEEEGLLGSRGYAAKHFGQRDTTAAGGLKKLPDYDKFYVYFNNDNGTGKVRGVYMQGNEAVRPIFRAWLAPFASMDASTLTMSNTGGTDHQSFDGIGLPGFQFIQDQIEYDTRTHHTNMDTYERVVEEDVKQAAVIMAAFAYNAAMRDGKFPRKPFTPQMGPRGF